MENMNQIVERKNKPFFKLFVSVLSSVVLIDFVMFLGLKINKRYPYLSNILVLLLVVISCSLIIIKFFSKFHYILKKDSLVFNRIIGKRCYKILSINFSDISYIKPYDQVKNKNKDYIYKFVFEKDYNNFYLGRFKKGGKYYSFLFNPNSKMINKLNRELKKN